MMFLSNKPPQSKKTHSGFWNRFHLVFADTPTTKAAELFMTSQRREEDHFSAVARSFAARPVAQPFFLRPLYQTPLHPLLFLLASIGLDEPEVFRLHVFCAQKVINHC
jgi:hypothetical protein